MASRITKWGNSLGLRIPKVLAEQAGLKEGSFVDVSLEDGRILIRAVQPPSLRLDDLLAAVHDGNVHEEVSTGEPVGREVW
jgi:antitoxin MazE